VADELDLEVARLLAAVADASVLTEVGRLRVERPVIAAACSATNSRPGSGAGHAK
jgi:hypothetical protein